MSSNVIFKKLKGKITPVVEVLKSLKSICSTLHERKTHNFMSLKVKELLAQKRKDGLDEACDRFCAEVAFLYNTCLEYLEKWMRLSLLSCGFL